MKRLINVGLSLAVLTAFASLLFAGCGKKAATESDKAPEGSAGAATAKTGGAASAPSAKSLKKGG